MVTPSIIFYVIFAIPYLYIMYWLLKQDKQKYVWGMAILAVIAVVGIVVSQKASRVAIENYKQHQLDARKLEKEADSVSEQFNRDSVTQ